PELLEGQPDTKEIGNKLQEILEPYYRPKYIWTTDCIPQTENGKVNRAKCRILAKQMLTTFYTHTLTP
ncbi:O-succinylbenzoic acid--CoA ligase, partial [Bacteroides xylanisolvens]